MNLFFIFGEAENAFCGFRDLTACHLFLAADRELNRHTVFALGIPKWVVFDGEPDFWDRWGRKRLVGVLGFPVSQLSFMQRVGAGLFCTKLG